MSNDDTASPVIIDARARMRDALLFEVTGGAGAPTEGMRIMHAGEGIDALVDSLTDAAMSVERAETSPVWAVRELHKPVPRDSRYTAYFDDAPAALMCDGCPDVSNGEYNLTDWPCDTARLVYSPTEIEETATA